MRISIVGHCTVLIETSGAKIVTDPYFDLGGNLTYERLTPPAKTREELRDVDLVLVSHNHWDHVDGQYLDLLALNVPVVTPKGIKRIPRLRQVRSFVEMNEWESRRFGEISVTAVPADHITRAVGYVVQSEGRQIYFAGDTYYHSFMREIGQQFRLDVALMPVTTYRVPMTMGEKDAVRAAEALSPRIVIPIHLGIRPRLSFLRTDHTPEGFQRRVQEARLKVGVIILREGQSWEI